MGKVQPGNSYEALDCLLEAKGDTKTADAYFVFHSQLHILFNAIFFLSTLSSLLFWPHFVLEDH